jgi:hypothetical protein
VSSVGNARGDESHSIGSGSAADASIHENELLGAAARRDELFQKSLSPARFLCATLRFAPGAKTRACGLFDPISGTLPGRKN